MGSSGNRITGKLDLNSLRNYILLKQKKENHDEHQRELLAAKRKKLREEYKAMVEFVEEDKRIRKTERKEIADKVADLEVSLDALRRQKHHLFQQFKEMQCEEERRKMADWEEKMRNEYMLMTQQYQMSLVQLQIPGTTSSVTVDPALGCGTEEGDAKSVSLSDTSGERRPSLLSNDPRGVLLSGQRETPGSGPACLPLRRSGSGSPAGTPTDPRAGVSTPASSRHTTAGAPLTDPRVMQLTRPDPRQKQGTPPTTPLTQVHPQPAPLHFMQQQPQQLQLAGRFPMPPTGVLPHEPSQLSFFGSRDSQPPPLMSPVAMRPLNPPDMHTLSSPFSPPGPGHMDRSPCPPLLSYRPRLAPAPGLVLDSNSQFSPLSMPPPLMGGGLRTPTLPLPPQPQAVGSIQSSFTSTDKAFWPSGAPSHQFPQQQSGSGSAGSSPSISSPQTANFNLPLLNPQ